MIIFLDCSCFQQIASHHLVVTRIFNTFHHSNQTSFDWLIGETMMMMTFPNRGSLDKRLFFFWGKLWELRATDESLEETLIVISHYRFFTFVLSNSNRIITRMMIRSRKYWKKESQSSKTHLHIQLIKKTQGGYLQRS